MKSSLHFDLPEEKSEFEDAVNGSKYKAQIDTLYDEVFRPIMKYGKPIIGDELTDEQLAVVESIWAKVNEHFDTN